MDTETVLRYVVMFLGSSVGLSLLVWAFKQVGVFVKKTENKYDDFVYNLFPDLANIVIEKEDFGKAEEILEGFLEKLESVPEDTTELEKIIKVKKDDLKKLS